MPPKDERSTVELLYEVSRELAAAVDLHSVLGRLLLATLKYVGGERATIVIMDENSNVVDSAIVYGRQFRKSNLMQLQETIDSGLAGWTVRNRKAVLVVDTRDDERWLRLPDDKTDGHKGKSAICVPILARNQLVGVMTVVHSRVGALGEDDFFLVQAIADQAGIALLNAMLYDRLQTAHQRYHQLFEDSIDPIIITDWEGKLLEANQQAIFLFDNEPRAFQELNIQQVLDVPKEKVGVDFANLHDSACCYQTEHRNAEGKSLTLEVHAKRVMLGSNDLIQWFLRDVTERSELDRMREELAAMIYHDIRSPLANVVSSVEILSTMLPDDPATQEAAQTVLNITQHSIDRIQRLVNSLLDVHRLEAGQPITEREYVEVHTLAHEAENAVQTMTSGRNQVLQITIPQGLPAVKVDQDMIRRVLINLLENASKYTPPGSQISLGAEAQGKMVLVWIKDNGPGINSDDQLRIFEKYRRFVGKGAPQGLGVGLAFCRLAVEAHGGRIWLVSETGNGACFYLTLPTE